MTSGFIDTRLSVEVSYGFTSIPRYNTRRTKLENKKQYRNILWDDAERRFTANYSRFTPANYSLLLACFHGCYGGGYGFRFRDWSDYQVIDGVQSKADLTAPTGTQAIQLQKRYTFGTNTNVRLLTKIVPGTLVVKEAGVTKAGTPDYNTGQFVPTVAWGGGEITASFEFDVPVQFINDELPSTYEEFESLSVTCELEEIDPLT